MHAAIGHQHRRDTPAQQQPNLLEWGLEPEAYVAAARMLTHPFAEEPQTELDLSFAVGGYVCLGLRITDARRIRRRVLRKVAKAVRPLDSYLLECRHCKLDLAPGSALFSAPCLHLFVDDLAQHLHRGLR